MMTEEIVGRISKVYKNSGPNFTAGEITCKGAGKTRFKASFLVCEGDEVTLRGRWIDDPSWGRQFWASGCAKVPTVSGLEKYLAQHEDFRGIGPARARIIAEFGADLDRLVEEEPEKVRAAAKLTQAEMDNFREAWLADRALHHGMADLMGMKVTYRQLKALVRVFGSPKAVKEVVEKDPYRLIYEVAGFGWKRVDQIALSSGFDRRAPSRIEAAIVHALREAAKESGDCWMYRDCTWDGSYRVDLFDAVDRLLSTSDVFRLFHEALASLEAKKHVVSFDLPTGEHAVALGSLHACERFLAEVFSKRGKEKNTVFSGDMESEISLVAPGLSAEQREAVRLATERRIMLLSGGAGSGKTHTIKAIVSLYEERGKGVALLAPTGKAADRMREVVGRSASTIHRFLGYDGEGYKKDYLLDDAAPSAIIVDEFSMVDVELAWNLFRLVSPRVPIVLVGDHNQLPSVGPGAILRDMIERRVVPTVVLTQIVRQKNKQLRDNALAILDGEVRSTVGDDHRTSPWFVVDDGLGGEDEIAETVVGLLAENLSAFDLDFREVQLLCPVKRGTLGTRKLNLQLQREVQRVHYGVRTDSVEDDEEDDGDEIVRPSHARNFYVNDRVIHTKNNYELGVMNGMVGIVREVEREANRLVVEYDTGFVPYNAACVGQLELAYALTVHKYQGSQIRCVVALIAGKTRNHHRNLFYTAVTRATERVIIIGDRQSIDDCAKRGPVERKTFLSVVEF